MHYTHVYTYGHAYSKLACVRVTENVQRMCISADGMCLCIRPIAAAGHHLWLIPPSGLLWLQIVPLGWGCECRRCSGTPTSVCVSPLMQKKVHFWVIRVLFMFPSLFCLCLFFVSFPVHSAVAGWQMSINSIFSHLPNTAPGPTVQ